MRLLKFIFVSTVPLFMVSCLISTSSKDTETSEIYAEPRDTPLYKNDANNSNKVQEPKHTKKAQQEGITYFKIHDQKTGLVSSTVPFPSSWKQRPNDKEFVFEGPRNLKVSTAFGQQFTFGNGYYQSGRNVPPMELEQIIETYFMPIARQTRRTLVKTYELPKIATVAQQLKEQFWSFAPSQKTTKAYGLEWVDDQNMSYITVLQVGVDRSDYGNSWNMLGQYLQAATVDFEDAKKAFIYGLENTHYNPQWIAANNQQDIQRATVSNAAHQQRMAAIQARGNASQALAKTYSDISDISHAGYLKRSNINSAGHSKTINTIAENTVIANHGTGEHYTVPSGSQYYWVNNRGEYFGTNNANYDPRVDQTINQAEWTQFNIEN